MRTHTFSTAENYESYIRHFSGSIEVISVVEFKGELILTYRNVRK